ncbi:hypothetical protein [Plantactinospora sp. KLBMP9567]|uniref:hypothetical protein n=1 Tax=Plantactinospora sp. KLBMP9567 TaxID=3085900 RepID=UPI002981E0CA|nr:hypothetical protein [Plantactinospora sp. KLBMP9567]MDW5325361.1 hypothetical protein [Plantactinospora sp. KLBMP9567]
MDTHEQLLHLAMSDRYAERVRAGQLLSRFAGEPRTDNVLLKLLLDSTDTAVTDATAETLLARQDTAGLRLFAAAWHLAQPETGEHLNSAWSSALYRHARYNPEDQQRLQTTIAALRDDPNEAARQGARHLLKTLPSSPA